MDSYCYFSHKITDLDLRPWGSNSNWVMLYLLNLFTNCHGWGDWPHTQTTPIKGAW